MRIGTWNLENHSAASRRSLQREVIAEAGADAFLLTEVNAAFDVGPAGLRSTLIESDGVGRSWVAIIGDDLEPMDDPRFTTVASAVGQVGAGVERVVVVGSVLPWTNAATQAPELRQGDETYIQMFERTLNEHGEFVRDLQAQPGAIVVWAGDFNQTLTGSNAGGSGTARELLRAKLDELDLVAWNEHMAHAIPGLKAIDLICGPASRPVRSIERIDPVRDGVRLSDHAGYVVEISAD